MAIKIQNSTIIDDSRNIIDAGITTVTSVSIGNTEVISSSRQLRNITSLDATTTATIESAISNAPNTLTDLNVTGVATFSNINVSGVSAISVNSSTDALRITQTGTGNALVVEDETNPDSSPFVIKGGGYGWVGIGTTNPREELHLQSVDPIIRFVDEDASTNNRNWNIGANNETFYFQALNDSGGGGQLFRFTRSSNEIVSFEGRNSANTWFVVNNSTQRVGIGTTNPLSGLDLVGVALMGGNDNLDVYTLTYADPSAIDVISIEAIDRQNIVKKNLALNAYGGNVLIGLSTLTGTANQRLQVTGGAYVSTRLGIGQTNPNTALHIGPYNGNTLPHLYLGSGNNNYGWRIDTQDFSGGSVPLRIWRRVGGTDTEVITVLNQNGNLGVGVTNPTSKLQVQGDVLVSGVVTATTFNGNLNSSGVNTATTISGTTATYTTGNFTTGNIVTGIVTNISGTNLNYTGISTITNVRSTTLNNTGVGTITTLNSTTGNLTNISGTNLNYTGISTITNVRSSTINNTGVITSTTYDTGVVASQTSGILTTTATTANQVVDNLATGNFQTAKYQVSIACTGQLVTAGMTTAFTSVGTIVAGAGYTQASYTNVALTGGSGNDARANIGIGLSYNLVGFTSATDLLVTTSVHGLPSGIGTIAVSFASSIPDTGFTGYAVTAGNIYYAVGVGTTTLQLYNDVGGTSQVTGIGITDFAGVGNTMTKAGGVSYVEVISPGSGYVSGNTLSATLGTLGSGFSFPVTNVVKNYQSTDVMIMQSVGSAATACDYIEYGTIANNEILGTFGADISGSNARLLITPTYRNNTIKWVRTGITV